MRAPEIVGTASRWWEGSEYGQGELLLPGQSSLDSQGVGLLQELSAVSTSGGLSIPPMPKAALHANRLLRAGEPDVGDVSDAIRLDPVLTAQVLRFANSALFAPRRTIDTVTDAVSFLGMRRMRELVTSVALQQSAASLRCREQARAEWIYSIYAANIAACLGKRFGHDTEQCYVAGLLHDIGRLPLISELETRGRVAPQGIERDGAEEVVLETLHRGVGLDVARAWEEPPVVQDAIGTHLVSRDPSFDGSPQYPSTRMAEMAADLCLALGLGRPRRPFAILESPSFLDAFGSAGELTHWLDLELPKVLESVSTVT